MVWNLGREVLLMPWPRGPISWLASKSPTRRRGLAMLASAVVAGGLSRTAGSNSDSVALAANGDPLVLGSAANAATATTTLSGASAGVAFNVTNSAGQSITGGTSGSSAVGVQGNSKTSYGVVGTSVDIGAAGVQGTSTDGYGVYGLSASGPGVFGNSQNVGVTGLSVGNNGVNGQSTSGTGVYGLSTGGGQAAQFDGTVTVNGSFSATGIKSAIVKDSAGDYRRFYCLESPESFFEDFGRGQTSGGSASIALDSAFASMVNTSDYFVFLTEVGSSSGLYVASQSS